MEVSALSSALINESSVDLDFLLCSEGHGQRELSADGILTWRSQCLLYI